MASVLTARSWSQLHRVQACRITDDDRRGVGERMETVGENRNRPREVPEAHLRDGDDQIEDENAAENADDRPVPVGQNTCAVGIGHHRSCTLPMMYFFGTKPQ